MKSSKTEDYYYFLYEPLKATRLTDAYSEYFTIGKVYKGYLTSDSNILVLIDNKKSYRRFWVSILLLYQETQKL